MTEPQTEMIELRLPDGSVRSEAAGITGADLAAQISRGLAKNAIAVEVDGELWDLTRPIQADCAVRIVTVGEDDGLYVLRHSTAHVMAQAVTELFPGVQLAIGPPIADGFYYDFALPGGATFSDEDLEAIETRMRELIAKAQPFTRQDMSLDEGRLLFGRHGQDYKLQIIDTVDAHDEIVEGAEDGTVSVYWIDDPQTGEHSFLDLCRGPHVPDTSRLGHFKLMKLAGAYWRGSEKNPMLQRIYGTAWAKKSELDEYLHRLAEAERRDHRKLGTELDLYSFPEELGGGLAVWHPNGATVRRIMEDYSYKVHQSSGYQLVTTPHLAKSDLFEISGHLGFYKESMYPPMEMDGATYYPKPMNCPFHLLIYRNQTRSYRELPMRLFELGTVYRYERSGQLHGLMRIRGFTQDDSHIFCTREDIVPELKGLLQFVISMLRTFGFETFSAEVSTRPLEKSFGTDEDWDMATSALIEAIEGTGLDYKINEGDGAFYGPKIDIHLTDAIGRSWQVSTLQVDFQMPQRFGLEYVGADNSAHRPIMIHRALFGSIERFFGILVEHYVGAFPLWLAPVQVAVLGVADRHDDYAEQVAQQARDAGLRAEVVSASQDTLGARIRKAKVSKIPYILVVGDSDVEAGTVGVNVRGSDSPERDVPVAQWLARAVGHVESRAAEL